MENHHRIGRRRLLGGVALLAFAVPGVASAKGAPAEAPPPHGTLLATDFGLVPDAPQDQSVVLQRAVEVAAQRGLPLLLPNGRIVAADIRLPPSVTLLGIDGGTWIAAAKNTPIFQAQSTAGISLKGIGLDGLGKGPADSRSGLLAFSG